MSLTVFFAVLGAAFLHAGWNGLIRLGASKVTVMLVMTLSQGAGGLILILFYPWPAASVWPWLLASGVFHAAYKLCLAFAYERGELSRVYPLARGAAPMIVLVVTSLFLAARLSLAETVGVVILGTGILLMARGVFSSGEDRRMIPFALGSAAMTAGYSIVDGLGARVAGSAGLFVAWMFMLDALFFTPALLALRGSSVFRAGPRVWGMGALAALASYGAYLTAVWAMTQAPIALVTALRETSILFAILIGWLAFGERMDRGKAIAAGLIICGVVVTRL